MPAIINKGWGERTSYIMIDEKREKANIIIKINFRGERTGYHNGWGEKVSYYNGWGESTIW